MSNIISFVGLEREDIPYYIAQAIAEKNKNVLVIDNSMSHNLFLSFHRIDEDDDSVESGRILYLRNKNYSEKTFEKFDVVIVFMGLNPVQDLIDISEKVVFVTSYMPSDIRIITKYINTESLYEQYKDKMSILFVEKPSNKVSEKFIESFYEFKTFEDEFVLSFDETDFAMRQNFQINGSQQWKGVSSEMKDYIKLYTAMFDTAKKAAKKGVTE